VENILDPMIGELRFRSYEWGYDDQGDIFEKFTNFPTHVCSREELGLEGDPEKHKFMPTQPRSKSYVDLYQKKFNCIDESELKIHGDF